VAMMLWNFAATRSISKAAQEFRETELKASGIKSVSVEFDRIKEEVAGLGEKAGLVEAIDSRIDVANILAEISFLIDRTIVVRKIDFIAEKFADSKATKNSSAVRMVTGKSGGENAELYGTGDVRFKVIINGVASDAGDVAALICKLEDSPYFRQVYPLFSRNSQVKAAGFPGGDSNTEFEVSCYLANYNEEITVANKL